MISLAQQLKDWRSRYRLGKHEAAQALGITVSALQALEQGQVPVGRDRDILLNKLSRPPNPGIRGALPDAGFRPEGT